MDESYRMTGKPEVIPNWLKIWLPATSIEPPALHQAARKSDTRVM
jgi:hypothetical protein